MRTVSRIKHLNVIYLYIIYLREEARCNVTPNLASLSQNLTECYVRVYIGSLSRNAPTTGAYLMKLCAKYSLHETLEKLKLLRNILSV